MRLYCIYKIQINESIYIGSTVNVNDRISKHKQCSCDDKCCNKLYTYMRQNGGWSDSYFSVIETLFADDITARKKEEEYINLYDAGLNTQKTVNLTQAQKFIEVNLTDLKNKILSNITNGFL